MSTKSFSSEKFYFFINCFSGLCNSNSKNFLKRRLILWPYMKCFLVNYFDIYKIREAYVRSFILQTFFIQDLLRKKSLTNKR